MTHNTDIEQQLSELIHKHLGFEGKTNDKWWLQASIKYYLESGKLSGSLIEGIKKIVAEASLFDKKQVASDAWDEAADIVKRYHFYPETIAENKQDYLNNLP